jgi:SAM-dependent methyltransferase
LYTLEPTKRFTDRAADYARFRPGYPPEAIDGVLEGMGDPGALTAADVGAGTGISSRLLADRGVRVIAIEPNQAMREAAASHPRVEWRDATAEETGLADGSADLVVCAQSFHWFQPTQTLDEFHRVLRPAAPGRVGGRVALMWNRREESDPASAEYARLVVAAAQGDPASLEGIRREPLAADPRFVNFRTLNVRHHHLLNLEGLIGRAMSASYTPRSGREHERLIAGLRQLHQRYADADGNVSVAQRTIVMLAERCG